MQAGHAVLGAYMSPVNDAYRKPGLLPASHRIAMSQLAAAESDLVMVDTWEAAQTAAQRSLIVLQRIQSSAQAYYDSIQAQTSSQLIATDNEAQQQTDQQPKSHPVGSIASDNKDGQQHAHVGRQTLPNSPKPIQVQSTLCKSAAYILYCAHRFGSMTALLSSVVSFGSIAKQVMQTTVLFAYAHPQLILLWLLKILRFMQVKAVLVCGADVLESFIEPGVWVEDQVRQILGKHGVVCIARSAHSPNNTCHIPTQCILPFARGMQVQLQQTRQNIMHSVDVRVLLAIPVTVCLANVQLLSVLPCL